MKNKFNENKGITLIALVITILVMLILAAVSISLVVGEDGTIERANDAVEKTEYEQIIERIELVKQGILIPQMVNKDPSLSSIENFRDALLKEFNVEDTDKNGDAIIDLDSPYSILLFIGLNYEVVEKEKIYIPKSDKNGWYIDPDYERVSYNGEDKEKIIIPVKIGDKVVNKAYNWIAGFGGSSDVKEVIIPDGIVTIGSNAFSWTSIKEVMLPNSVKIIEDRAFWLCHNLTNIILSEGITSIGEEAFEGCGFKTITIPNSVTTIEKNAFLSCNKLETIYFEAGENPIPSGQNWGAPSSVKIVKLEEKKK